MEHPDKEVQAAIIRLTDALCTWERATYRDSVLILKEEGGFKHRAFCGKPDNSPDISDEHLLSLIK